MDMDELLRFIALRIDGLCEKYNLNHTELSIALGFNENYINQIVGEKAYPSLRKLDQICKHFGITVREFFDYPLPAKSPKAPIIAEIEKQLQKMSLEGLQGLLVFTTEANKPKETK